MAAVCAFLKEFGRMKVRICIILMSLELLKVGSCRSLGR